MDRKLGEHVPITMYRLVERVARGIHRLYLVSSKEPTAFSLSLFAWVTSFAHMRNGTAAAAAIIVRDVGGGTRTEEVQRTLEAGGR
jgi:hypothetical protein